MGRLFGVFLMIIGSVTGCMGVVVFREPQVGARRIAFIG